MHVNDALIDINYLDWVQEMENFLFAKNKMGFINGTIKRPEAGDAKQMAWMRCDAMIKGWLTTAMEKEIRGSVKYATSASEIWKDLQEWFRKESASRAYELKQASRNWYQKFMSALLQLNYKQSAADHSLFIYNKGKVFVTALIYVDDVIMAGNDEDQIKETKKFLNEKFSIKDLGPLKYFLGIEAARTKDGIVLSQQKYTLDFLEDSGMLGCRQCTFPMEPNIKLDKGEDDVRIDASKYRRLVGRLLYLQATRPYLAYSVNVLSQFVSDPHQMHMDAAMRVLRYLKATPGQGIFFPKEGGGAPISWKSKKQSVVSRSSAEAEYRAMANATSEILWMCWLLEGLETKQHDATPLYCDNNAARHIANNPVFHERTKHVEMDCYFVKERVESHEIKPFYVNKKVQTADLLIKALGTKQLESLLVKMGMRNMHAPP
ncbi:uncharacterized mitochondrial protein-like protein [Tanacetum coccineum]